MIAQRSRLGNITEASLNDSVARFKRFVNEFKQKNKINYSYKRPAEGKVHKQIDEWEKLNKALTPKEAQRSAERVAPREALTLREIS